MAWSVSDWLFRALANELAKRLDSIDSTLKEVRSMEGDTLQKVTELKKDNERVIGALNQTRQDLADLRTQIDQNAGKAAMLAQVDSIIEDIDTACEGASPEQTTGGGGDTGGGEQPTT